MRHGLSAKWSSTALRRPALLAVLAVTAAMTMAAGPGSPAAASCHRQQRATVITDTPWPQDLWNLSELPAHINGKGQLIAVVDSGVDTSHDQLKGAVAGGRDLLASGDGTKDCVGHGTGVASLIAARKVNGVGFHGLAPAAELLSVRASERISDNPTGQAADVAQVAAGIDWAVQQGATVINLSLTYTNEPESSLRPLRDAIDNATANDVVVVAAVGNKFTEDNPTPYPASWDKVLGVGAIGPDGQRQAQSQTGSYVDLMAPGDGVTAAAIGKGHVVVGGTSYAAPLVAATAALVRQRYPTLNEAQVRARLIATADPAPGGAGSDSYGAGILNPVRAINDLVASGSPVLEPPLVASGLSAAELAARQQAERTRERALWAAGIGTLAVAVVFALAGALPSARRRRWQSGG